MIPLSGVREKTASDGPRWTQEAGKGPPTGLGTLHALSGRVWGNLNHDTHQLNLGNQQDRGGTSPTRAGLPQGSARAPQRATISMSSAVKPVLTRQRREGPAQPKTLANGALIFPESWGNPFDQDT